MLAVTIWTRKKQFDARGIPADKKTGSLMLAGAPQTRKQTICRSREPRRQENKQFDACGNPADKKTISLALAVAPLTRN